MTCTDAVLKLPWLCPAPCNIMMQRVLLPCSYVWTGGQYWQVPASRADIFRDSTLKPPEKRLLMRYLQKLQQHAVAAQDEHRVHDLPPGPATQCISAASPH